MQKHKVIALALIVTAMVGVIVLRLYGTRQQDIAPKAQTVACSAQMQNTSTISIWRPRFVVPEFKQKGQSFVAEVRGPATISTTGWCAWLENDLRSWPVSVTAVASGKINNETEDGWRFTLQVPTASDFPPELFTLTIGHPNIGKVSVHNAVSVVKDLEAPFYIMHFTDEHVAQNNATTSDGYRSAELIRWSVPVVNLANPRFVLNTGDQTSKYVNNYTSTDPDPLFDWYKDAKIRATFASITIPGNHDIPWDQGFNQSKQMHGEAVPNWERILGQRSFSVRVGSFYVLAHDYSDTDVLNTWVKPEYERAWADPSVKFRLVAQHFKDWAAFIPPAGKGCDLMVLGHIHVTENNTPRLQNTCARTVMTIAAHEYARGGFLDFAKNTSGSWYITNGAAYAWNTPYSIAMVGANGVPKIKETFTAPNDGTQTNNSAGIKNDLQLDFYDGRIRFLMQRGTYAVTGGEKLAEYHYANDTKTAVLVKVNIRKSTTTQVSLNRTGIPPTNPQPTTTTVPPTNTGVPQTSPTVPVSDTIFYVAPNGSDINNGRSLTTPFKTIGKAVGVVTPGAIVYVRGGTYPEQVKMTKGGTAQARVVITKYQNETPVIDGASVTLCNGVALNCSWGLLEINDTADYVTISGFTFQNSMGRGITVWGDNVKIENNKVTKTKEAGITSRGTTNLEVANNDVSDTGRMRLDNPQMTGGWPSAVSTWESTNAKFVNNKVYNNHGEGINSWKSTTGTLISGNTVFDNWGVNIYLDSAANSTIENNLIYETETSYIPFNNSDRRSAVGIAISEENYTSWDPAYTCRLANNVVRNNMIINTSTGISYFPYMTTCPTGWKNFIIENNTFVNVWENGIRLTGGTHTGNVFRNNIFLMRTAGQNPGRFLDIDNPGDTKFQNNLFFSAGGQSASLFASGTSNQSFTQWSSVTNNTNNKWSDPKFASLGTVTAEAYKITTGSPAIDSGIATSVVKDYFGNTRPLDGDTNGTAVIDIGAHEFGNASTSTKASLTISLHGLGNGGDNVSPNGTGNMNPVRKQRQANIELFNETNQSMGRKTGSIIFNTTAGNFQGTIELGNVPSGVYTAKIKVPNYLQKTVPGIITVTTEQTVAIPSVALVTGDANDDNALSIFDYNILLDCFSDLSPARNCADPAKKLSTDLTDDGNVNQFDYNLFLRELSIQSGQ